MAIMKDIHLNSSLLSHRDELLYILDLKEVHGENFPGETFRVLKGQEIRLYGEYGTRCLVLDRRCDGPLFLH